MAGKRSTRRKKDEKLRKEKKKIEVYLDGLGRGIKKRQAKLAGVNCPDSADQLSSEIERLKYNQGVHRKKLERFSV